VFISYRTSSMLDNLLGNAQHASTARTIELNTSPFTSVLPGKSALEQASPTFRLNRSTSATLEQALQDAETALSKFATDRSFTATMNLAFGDRWNPQVAKQLFQAWAAHDFRNLPKLEIRLGSEINNANGAFASATNTIYISRDFLVQNANNPKAVTSVLIEEIGHAIDFRINKTDAVGDEGDIFSRLVRGEKISAGELMLLKMEDDSATINLGGKSIRIEQSSTLEAARNKDGRLEEFTISAEGKVMQRYQLAVNSSWSGWNDLGLVAGGKELEVVQNQDGRLELFVIGKDNEVYQSYQKAPNGIGGWSGWNKFGLQASEIEVSVDQDGRLEAFAIRTDGSLMQKYQVSVNSSWTGWIDFGRQASEIDMVQNKDGRLELFAIEKGTNEVFQRYQLKANGIGGWSSWNQFGLQAKDIEVVQNKDGRLEAFAIRTDGEVFEKYQTAVNSSWSGWNQFGVKASEIEVAQNADGRLELFAIRDNGGDLLHKWQTAVNSSWSNWTSTNLQAVEVESIRNADGRLEIFAIDISGQVQSQWQLKANGTTGWSSWNQQSGIKAVGEDQLANPINPLGSTKVIEVLNSLLGKKQITDVSGNNPGQCVSFVKQYTYALGFPMNPMGNGGGAKYGFTNFDKPGLSLSSKQAEKITFTGKEIPQAGDIIFFDGTAYGHIAVVQEVLDGGIIRIQESNGNDGALKQGGTSVTRREISLTPSKNTGVYRNIMGWLRLKL
jgi:surface antigen